MDITLHQLRCFLAVAEEQHFGRAAASLRMAPSSLSQQVAGLERALGRRLFDRTSRSVALTADGAELVPLAREATASVGAIAAWAEGEAATELRIGYAASSTGLRMILGAALERLPAVTPRLVPLGLAGGADDVRRGAVDCAVSVELAPGADHAGIAAVELWEEPLVVALPSAHRLADRVILAPDDLFGEVLVGMARKGARDVPWYGAIDPRLPERCRIEHVATSADETMEVVAAGMGLNIAGASIVGAYGRDGIAFVPLATSARVASRVLTRDEPGSPALRAFVALAAETMAGIPR